MATRKLLGYFLKIGSQDYPLNMSPNEKFGWDLDANGNSTVGPLFKYSLNDVEKAFDKVRQIQIESFYDSNSGYAFKKEESLTNLVDMLMVETDGKAYESWASASPSSTVVQSIMKCLEYLYTNQSTIQNGDQKVGKALNNGDSALGEQILSDASTNPYYVASYKENSLVYFMSNKAGRIERVEFSVVDPSTADEIQCIVYFDADTFIERASNASYAVYRYEDLDGDAIISDSEFDSQIINKVFNILKEGKYKTYSKYSVTKRTGNNTYTEEQFFVFGSLNQPLTTSKMIECIKEYLLGTDTENNLHFMYPTLFGQNEIRIIPVWDNQIMTSENGAISVYPVSFDDIRTIVNNEKPMSQTEDNAIAELFYIGPGAGWVQSVNVTFVLPLIAIEMGATGVTRPISARFPDYQPIYGQNFNTDAAEFHFVLLKVLAYLKDNTNSLTDSFKAAYNVKVVDATNSTADEAPEAVNVSTREEVQFTFGGNIWTVVGYNKIV